MSSLDGKTIGEFKILTKIGQGAMGAVYLAEQPSLRRAVAVKIMMAELARDPEYSKRFKREGMLAASLNHPNIVQVYGAGEAEDVHYIAMEYISGESLERKMTREGKIDPAQALNITIRLTEALDHTWHKANMIHRDVKPSNVLVSTTGEVKLADFGMAKSAACDSTLTATGMLVGTPLYISPEQARCDDEADFRTDIYSLGCTLYHMLCGKPPFTANAAFAIAFQHVTKPLPSMLDSLPDCPPHLVKLVNRMAAKRTADRQASYAALLEDLRQAQELLGKPRQRPLGPIFALGSILVAGVALYFALKYFPAAASPSAARPLPQPTAAPVEQHAIATHSPAISPPAVASLPAIPTPESTSVVTTPVVATVTDAPPLETQVKAVLTKIKELNPEFDPKTATYSIDDSGVNELAIDITAVRDISPLKALSTLKRLRLGQTGKTGVLESLEGLRGMTVRILECHNTPISDLSPLHGMPLVWFVCSGTHVSDLTPLKDCPLQALGINDTGVSDLTPISGLPLRFINCGVTQVTDLTPLQGMPLVDLNCTRTPVHDLSPIANLPLTRLICSRTSIEDLSPIRGMPLKEIECDLNYQRDEPVLRTIATLEKINGQPVTEFWKSAK